MQAIIFNKFKYHDIVMSISLFTVLVLTITAIVPYTCMNSVVGTGYIGNGEGNINCILTGQVDNATIRFSAFGEFEDPFSLDGSYATFESSFNNSGPVIYINEVSMPYQYNLLYNMHEATECSSNNIPNIAIISGECGQDAVINFKTELMEGNFTGQVNCFK